MPIPLWTTRSPLAIPDYVYDVNTKRHGVYLVTGAVYPLQQFKDLAMLARRFSLICVFTALLGIYAAIYAADIDRARSSVIACESADLLHCE